MDVEHSIVDVVMNFLMKDILANFVLLEVVANFKGSNFSNV